MDILELNKNLLDNIYSRLDWVALTEHHREFPGCLVFRIPCFHCSVHRFNPWSRKYGFPGKSTGVGCHCFLWIYVYLWLIHVVPQRLIQHCKTIILQLKTIKFKKYFLK